MSVTGIATYRYNGLGQRIQKDVSGTLTRFVYGLSGELLAEFDAVGAPKRDYVSLGGEPLALITYTPGTPPELVAEVDYVHTDHLATPRAVTDSAGTLIWRWNADPFGTTPADEDPDGDGQGFTYNPRFPGQYFDAESGLHYNYYRVYDPGTGRYLESDPIGLDGGGNTYAYVNDNPLSFVDPLGLVGEPQGWPGGYPELPLSDDKLRGRTENELKDMHDRLRRAGNSNEADKVKKYQKYNQLRNKNKQRGGPRMRGGGALILWEIVQEMCRMGVITGMGCLPENDTSVPPSC